MFPRVLPNRRPTRDARFRLQLVATLFAALVIAWLAPPSQAAQSFPAGVSGHVAADGALILRLDGEIGILNAPVPDSIRAELLDDFALGGDPDEVYVLNQQIVEAIDRSIESGEVDPYLEPYLNQVVLEKGGGCNNQMRTYSRSYDYAWDGSKTGFSSHVLGSKFDGSMVVNGDLSGRVTLEARYKVKRARLFWLGPCVSYWVSPKSARAFGDASVDGDFDAVGEVSNTNDPWTWQWDVANVDLGTVEFSVFGIPLAIDFTLPITAGLTVEATVTANVDFDSDAHFSGTFDYSCTRSGCSGTSDFQMSGFGDATILASIEGRVELEGFLDVGARAELRLGPIGLLEGQVGVRGVAYADLWGYYGNLCGDRDGDGTNEVVSALTLNFDLQAFLNAELKIGSGGTSRWPDLAHTNRYHLFFIDLIGSDAIEPLFHGPSEVYAGEPASFSLQMPPCWPYDDTVDYALHWGDGTVDYISGAPGDPVTLSHTFGQPIIYSASASVLEDSHGRSLGYATERTLDAEGLLATLNCYVVGGPIYQCDGAGLGGTTPYFPEWRVIGDPIYSDEWSPGGFSRQYQCKNQQSYTLQFRITDAAGVSDIATWSCNGGPI